MTDLSQSLSSIRAAVEEAKKKHRAFAVYDECGHKHTEEELEAGGVVVVEELDAPYTCAAGLVYTCCFHCGTDEGEVREDSHEEKLAFPCDAHRLGSALDVAVEALEAERARHRTANPGLVGFGAVCKYCDESYDPCASVMAIDAALSSIAALLAEAKA